MDRGTKVPRLGRFAPNVLADEKRMGLRPFALRRVRELCDVARSKVAKTELVGPDGYFNWQEGYGVYAFQHKLIPVVVEYIETQQERHERNNLWGHLEAMDEEAPLKTRKTN